MKKIAIGILGAADIAERRFLPALKKSDRFTLAGVAVSSVARQEKAEKFTAAYGGKVYIGYEALLCDAAVDAVYIPQPPALHYQWAKQAIACGKHVLLEKPATIRLEHTQELVRLAREAGTAIAENYAFCYHRQVAAIRSVIESGQLGELRLIRAAFGFPHRDSRDFRYEASLGGGALFDCGGYTLKAAQLFLGDDICVKTSKLNFTDSHEVDLFGSATLENIDGLTAQVSFGMDNCYKCELEVWGSKGYVLAPRFFTPPADLETTIMVKTGDGDETLQAGADDQFCHLIEVFADCIKDPQEAQRAAAAMLRQMKLVDEIQAERR